MEEKEERQTDRRRLLRGAGAVVAGVAGAGVAGAVAATPAAAATGDPVLAGNANSANATTNLTLSGATTPAANAALRLTNAGGPALTADPVAWEKITEAPPAGSVFVDTYGDVYTVGNVSGNKFVNLLYSPTWAVMPVPVKPFRWLDTRYASGRANVVAGTVSSGKIVPKGTTGPDLVLDFSSILVESYVAAQVIVSVHAAPADGWLTLWGDGAWPEAVTVNFLAGRVIGGYAQSELTGIYTNSAEPFGRMKLKITHAAAVTIDVVGFITPDPYTLFKAEAASTYGAAPSRTPKVAPRKR